MWRCLYPYFTQWVDIMGAVVAEGLGVLQSAYWSNSEQDTEARVSPYKEIEVWVCPKRALLFRTNTCVNDTCSKKHLESMLSRAKLSVLVCEICCCKCKKQWVSLSVTDHTHTIFTDISVPISFVLLVGCYSVSLHQQLHNTIFWSS